MFYDVYAEMCKKKKICRCAAAVAIGISKSNVTAWKNGRSPNLETVIKIADYFQIQPAKLVPKSEEKTAHKDG